MDTAKIAAPIMGDKLYQVRARTVLPILVRQAEAGTPIVYSALAEEVGIPNPRNCGVTEFALASGDAADVYFVDRKDWVAVEVKSAISNEADITRGLFQCVKYKAVLEAMQLSSGLPQNARSILAIESALPLKLIALKNILGVEVVDLVQTNG